MFGLPARRQKGFGNLPPLAGSPEKRGSAAWPRRLRPAGTQIGRCMRRRPGWPKAWLHLRSLGYLSRAPCRRGASQRVDAETPILPPRKQEDRRRDAGEAFPDPASRKPFGRRSRGWEPEPRPVRSVSDRRSLHLRRGSLRPARRHGLTERRTKRSDPCRQVPPAFRSHFLGHPGRLREERRDAHRRAVFPAQVPVQFAVVTCREVGPGRDDRVCT